LLHYLRKRHGLSEKELARISQVSRSTLRAYESGTFTFLGKLEKVVQVFDYHAALTIVPNSECNGLLSTLAVSMAVIEDGFSSWKIHFFNLVDEFRRTPDTRLLVLPPSSNMEIRLRALLAGIVCELCDEVAWEFPDWARKHIVLDQPWFVSEMESLKATCILESPLNFRRNNIFVQENFLKRA
jgi:transcriptional regulator with XRE-family HTH domain